MYQKEAAKAAWTAAGLYRSRDPKLRDFLKHVETEEQDCWPTLAKRLRANSPEPFGSDEAYYARFPSPPHGAPYPYPPSAYSILSWWDYGYLIHAGLY